MTPLRVVGVALIATGTVVLVGAFVRFVAEGDGTPAPIAPTQMLVVGGLYRYVRKLQIISFQPDNLLSPFKIMAAIDEAAQQPKPLPDPLPTPPPIPFAYLLALGRQIDSIELDQADQTLAVDQLRHAIAEESDESVRREILANLHVAP
jgi:hypothetical protein